MLGTSPESPTLGPLSSLAAVLFAQALACFSFTLILPPSSHSHPLAFICIPRCCLYLCIPVTWTLVWQARPDGMLVTLQEMSIFLLLFLPDEVTEPRSGPKCFL